MRLAIGTSSEARANPKRHMLDVDRIASFIAKPTAASGTRKIASAQTRVARRPQQLLSLANSSSNKAEAEESVEPLLCNPVKMTKWHCRIKVLLV
jgi:hypothetical protein